MLTYFEIAYEMAENTDEEFCLPCDVCTEHEIPDHVYASVVYEYTIEDECLFDMTKSVQDIKEQNIFFMLLCAAASKERFHTAF